MEDQGSGKKKLDSIEKTKLWMSVLSGSSRKPRNLNQEMASERILDVLIMIELHWTWEDIINCPDDVYSDLIQIMQMRNGIQNVKNKIANNNRTGKAGR